MSCCSQGVLFIVAECYWGERSTEVNFSFIKVNNRAVLRGRKSLDSGVDFLADSRLSKIYNKPATKLYKTEKRKNHIDN